MNIGVNILCPSVFFEFEGNINKFNEFIKLNNFVFENDYAISCLKLD